ncbi:MAG: SRPBCC family protein [Actinomycetota bacterium]|nr:SRPBCC family protein [Actinomycetota bacterium]
MSDASTLIEPIRKVVTVNCSVERAFRVFTAELGTWWPLNSHSIGDENAVTAVIEPKAGGRVFERWNDGSEHSWGAVLAWEPPHRFAISWRPNPGALAPTEVEVAFVEEDGATRVYLEHRGWERLGARASAARAQYDGGWPVVLGKFAQNASA